MYNKTYHIELIQALSEEEKRLGIELMDKSLIEGCLVKTEMKGFKIAEIVKIGLDRPAFSNNLKHKRKIFTYKGFRKIRTSFKRPTEILGIPSESSVLKWLAKDRYCFINNNTNQIEIYETFRDVEDDGIFVTIPLKPFITWDKETCEKILTLIKERGKQLA